MKNFDITAEGVNITFSADEAINLRKSAHLLLVLLTRTDTAFLEMYADRTGSSIDEIENVTSSIVNRLRYLAKE